MSIEAAEITFSDDPNAHVPHPLDGLESRVPPELIVIRPDGQDIPDTTGTFSSDPNAHSQG